MAKVVCPSVFLAGPLSGVQCVLLTMSHHQKETTVFNERQLNCFITQHILNVSVDDDCAVRREKPLLPRKRKSFTKTISVIYFVT